MQLGKKAILLMHLALAFSLSRLTSVLTLLRLYTNVKMNIFAVRCLHEELDHGDDNGVPGTTSLRFSFSKDCKH